MIDIKLKHQKETQGLGIENIHKNIPIWWPQKLDPAIGWTSIELLKNSPSINHFRTE